MMLTKEQADERLRAAVNEVASHTNSRRRSEALVALRRAAWAELVRVRKENRGWAIRAAAEWLEPIRSAASAAEPDRLGSLLEACARDLADASGDERFGTFTAGTLEITAAEAAARSQAEARWLVAFIAVRTGALDMGCVADADIDLVRSAVRLAQDTLRKAQRG